MTFLLPNNSDLNRVKCLELGNSFCFNISFWEGAFEKQLFLRIFFPKEPDYSLWLNFNRLIFSIGTRFGWINCWWHHALLRSLQRRQKTAWNGRNAGNCKIDRAARRTPYGTVRGIVLMYFFFFFSKCHVIIGVWLCAQRQFYIITWTNIRFAISYFLYW